MIRPSMFPYYWAANQTTQFLRRALVNLVKSHVMPDYLHWQIASGVMAKSVPVLASE